ncbi:hypothetical protein [Dasania marina]|uniref:hypothetical protein n=1 Tax=Dasania marina TaxID=471499 RepID=UPI000372EE96|nr:hypothetical protein [Dasania marina]|tara:strand:- start:33252 stop:33620 length:369 start_codon:yes stop_codon:yes gene_type:complete
MFLEVKKNPQVYLQNKDMDQVNLAPVTSNFRINLALIAEVSNYSLKEPKQKRTLTGYDFELPINTRVIHLEMSYTHSTHKIMVDADHQHTVNERYSYKLVFLPEAEDEYLRIRSIIDSQTLA